MEQAERYIDNPFDVSFTPCFLRIDDPAKKIPILRAFDRFSELRQAMDIFQEGEEVEEEVRWMPMGMEIRSSSYYTSAYDSGLCHLCRRNTWITYEDGYFVWSFNVFIFILMKIWRIIIIIENKRILDLTIIERIERNNGLEGILKATLKLFHYECKLDLGGDFNHWNYMQYVL